MDKYADLRDAVSYFDSGELNGRDWIVLANPDTIRALLAERDALEVATKEASEVIVDRNDEIRRLREALVKLLTGARAEMAESWRCNSYHPKLIAGMAAADAALAQEQGGSDGN